MPGTAHIARSGALRAGLAAAIVSLALLAWLQPARTSAATLSFGPSLSVPATLNTAENLNYEGSDVPLPGSVFHINHDGADTVLWNVVQPGGVPTVPAGGQILSFSLEGCAEQPEGAPPPLTQIHFQDLVPQAGGGFQIAISSQAFEIPVCGAGGASGSTVTTYAPANFCVNQGDSVAFNDEGGFVGGEGGLPPYPAGVPYQVIGRVPGASMDSFVRDGGTNNGATISPTDRTNHDGFASNTDEQLMLQATLATGADAADSCPGGTKSSYVPPPSGYSQKPAPALKVVRQTDGINHRRMASIAIYCHQASGCSGTLILTPRGAGRHPASIHAPFSIPGGKTSHVAVRVPTKLLALARHRRAKGVTVALTVSTAVMKVNQTIVLRIY